jgi:hypothetical protein
MLDVNGIELKAGDVVKVSGAYFKHDNGLYFIAHAPGDPSWSGSDCSLAGLNRNGALSKTRSCAFWPLCAYTNDHDKNIRAREHNSVHAKIEIVRGVPVAGMVEHFKEQKESAEYWEERAIYNWGAGCDEAKKNRMIADHYARIIDRLTAEN